MSELHYFPLLAADWLAGEAVSMMTPEQEGAFIHLLCYAWQSSGVPCSLPNDDATLAHLSRLGKRWSKVGAFVKAQFDVMKDDPTRLRNAKLWAIFSDASVKHERRVNAGKTGGIAKAERKQSSSNASPMLEHSSSNGASNALAKASNQNQNQSQSQRTEETTGASAPAIRVISPDVESVLAHFRHVHPKKRPDDKARRAITKALRSYSVQELCEAIDGNAADDWCRRTSNQSLPYLLRDNAQIDKYRAALVESQPRLAVDPLTGLPNAVGMAALSGRGA